MISRGIFNRGCMKSILYTHYDKGFQHPSGENLFFKSLSVCVNKVRQ